jgi:hypothetical protein
MVTLASLQGIIRLGLVADRATLSDDIKNAFHYTSSLYFVTRSVIKQHKKL